MKEKTKVFKAMKEVTKAITLQIKTSKNLVNQLMREGKSSWKEKYQLDDLRCEFRHFHIARCEMRGRTRDEIEKPGENHLPNEEKINNIKFEWTARIEEAIRIDQGGPVDSTTSCPSGACSCAVGS